MAAGRRGRPYQVPEDTTLLRSPSADVDARVGWLLLMSRLHHPDPGFALGESFNSALESVGLRADRSAVSRWESGKVTPRYSVLEAYEQALGMPPGQLTSVVNALRRALGGEGLSTWMPVLSPKSPQFHAELDHLFETLIEGPGDGCLLDQPRSPRGGNRHHVRSGDGVAEARSPPGAGDVTLGRRLLPTAVRGDAIAARAPRRASVAAPCGG
ncbi:MAG: helix-turn-helix transcriptional regulator [Nocardioidaceae bacterium]